MCYYSKASSDKLATCDIRIQRIMNEAIKIYDLSVVSGHRPPAEQFLLYKKGREMVLGSVKIWRIVNKDKVVTYCDGYDKLSDHNYVPAKAIDIIPYPTLYKNINEFYYMAGIINTIAYRLGFKIGWGGRWKSLQDHPHFYIMD